jgi:hypothetical protein
MRGCVFFKVSSPAIGNQDIVFKSFGHDFVNGFCSAAFIDGNICRSRVLECPCPVILALDFDPGFIYADNLAF